MDLYIVAMLLFYGTAKGAKQALRIGGGDIITVPDKNSEQPSRVMALVIVDDVEESEETAPTMKNDAPMLPWTENSQIKVPMIEVLEPEYNTDDEDISGESNSDEYSDSDTEMNSDEPTTDRETGTESESNYYHEDDYVTDKILKKLAAKNDSIVLRNRWKSCQKTASKICREACVASYKNACSQGSCKRKLKKTLKKECKRNCKEFFIDS